LRPGLLLGYNPTTRQWAHFDPAATDGTQTPAGVLLTATKTTINGSNFDRFNGVILVRGMIRAAGLSIANTATQGIVGNANEWLIRN
ncbi:head decoration protein, partial [Streptomyces caeruleatus]